MSQRPYTISQAFLWALSRRGVTLTARNVLAALWCYVDWQGGHNEVWPARHTISERLGIRRQAITAAISELAAAGLLAREGHATSKVILADPDPTLAAEARDTRAANLRRAQPAATSGGSNQPLQAAPAATSGICRYDLHHPAATSGTPTSRYDLHPQPLQAAGDQPLDAAPIADRSHTDHEQKTRTPIADPPLPPLSGEGKPAEPLALIPPEHIVTRPPEPDEVDLVIDAHNATADRINVGIESAAHKLARLRPSTRPRTGKKAREDLRSNIRARIDEHGLEVVLDVVRQYGRLAGREDAARGWYGAKMYTERSFAVARQQVIRGTSLQFRSERERLDHMMRHAGAHEVTTWPTTMRVVDAPEVDKPWMRDDFDLI